ncbi:hypothetical protein OH77DRAFT_1134039 [Trametes cingulata]|nr:hypothetical protein OH77DRAFT_1134039 [Trametes cingulata]
MMSCSSSAICISNSAQELANPPSRNAAPQRLEIPLPAPRIRPGTVLPGAGGPWGWHARPWDRCGSMCATMPQEAPGVRDSLRPRVPSGAAGHWPAGTAGQQRGWRRLLPCNIPGCRVAQGTRKLTVHGGDPGKSNCTRRPDRQPRDRSPGPLVRWFASCHARLIGVVCVYCDVGADDSQVVGPQPSIPLNWIRAKTSTMNPREVNTGDGIHTTMEGGL